MGSGDLIQTVGLRQRARHGNFDIRGVLFHRVAPNLRHLLGAPLGLLQLELAAEEARKGVRDYWSWSVTQSCFSAGADFALHKRRGWISYEHLGTYVKQSIPRDKISFRSWSPRWSKRLIHATECYRFQCLRRRSKLSWSSITLVNDDWQWAGEILIGVYATVCRKWHQ